jgi:hypothetical protein
MEISTSPLWPTLGVRFASRDQSPPDPVHWWLPDHPAVSSPESVPELTALTSAPISVFGQGVDVLEGAEAIGGHTDAPAAGQAALVVGNGGRSAFRGFIDGHNDADRDSDGVRDGVELWVDLIEGLRTGFSGDVPWLSVAPDQGTVAPGGRSTVTVTVDATGLAPGTHEAVLLVATNDRRTPLVRVPVRVDVGPAAPPT